MAGLRDLTAAPTVVADLPASDWTAEDATRIGASPFQRGIRSAALADQAGGRMQAALEAAAAGDMKTAAMAKAEAEDLANRSSLYSPPVNTYKDVHGVGDARDYLMGQAGQGLRSSLPPLIGGLAAAGLARFGGAGPAMTELAAGAGSLIPAYGMEKREAVMNAAADPTIASTHTPQEVLNAATAKGAINAGLEAAFPAVVAGRTANALRAGLHAPTLRGVASHIAGDMAIEGGTEAVQEKVGQLTQKYLNPNRDSTNDIDNMIDAAISGAVSAPLLGAHAHILDAAHAVTTQVKARAALGGTESTKLDTSAADTQAQTGSIPLGDEASPDEHGIESIPLDAHEAGAATREFAGNTASTIMDHAQSLFDDNKDTVVDKATRAKDAIVNFSKPAQDFYAGLTGKDQPKANAQYDATDRALFNTFHEAMPKEVSGDTEAVTAADMFRRFARGQLPPSTAVRTARTMIQAYGDSALDIADKAATVLRRDGVNDEAANKLSKVIKSMWGDEESRVETMQKGLDPLVSNSIRENFKQTFGREFQQRDLAKITDHLDNVVMGNDKNVAPLKQFFGENYQKALNVARAVHDARHQDVSNFNKLLEGPTTDETGHEEGNVASADFEARSAEKAVEKSAPTVYSFSDGDRTSASKGFGRPYDTKTEATKIADRKASLSKLYEGADVQEIPAAQYAKETGQDVAAVHGSLDGKVVLAVRQPTNTDALTFDRDTTKKLLGARVIQRDVQPGDEGRDKRYTVLTNKAGKQFTKVTNPGVDEGAMYVALNNAKGEPLTDSTGKRQYAMVKTDDLLSEMRKRDARESITTDESTGPKRDLNLLNAGLASLVLSSDSRIDGSAGITFISPDGKRSTVALTEGGVKNLPPSLKVGNTTVGDIQKAGNFDHQSFRNAVVHEFTSRDSSEVDDNLRRSREASLETKDLHTGTADMERVAALVDKYGFPKNPRENLTVEQKQALTSEHWSALVDQVVGKNGPKRELYDTFFTPKGYSRLTERAKAVRSVLPELERRAELMKSGETLDPETGIPIKNDTDQSIKEDKGESRLLEEEKTREDVAYNTRTQTRFTTQRFDTRPLTDAEMKDIKTHVNKVLGPQVKVEFERELGNSGEFHEEELGGTIKIAMMAGVNGMSVANHESLHAFFSYLMKNGHEDVVNTLQAAASSTAVRRQLDRLLATEPVARAQLKDPEERAAYMYQFWVADKAGQVKFNIGPETEGVFTKIANFFRKTLGMITTEQKAQAILQAFHDGKMQTAGEVERVLEHYRKDQKPSSLKSIMGDALGKAQQFVMPAYATMANSKNSEIAKIADLFYRDSTSTEKGLGFINARSQQGAVWLNKFSTVLKDISKEDLQAARDVLQGKTDQAPNKAVADAVNLTRGMLREFHQYLTDASVPVKFRRDYFPRAWDMDKITMNSGEFRKELLEHHRDDLVKLGNAAFESAMAKYRADAAKGKFGEFAIKPLESDYTAEKTAEHIEATLSQQNGIVADDVDPSKTKLSERADRPGFTPFMQAVNSRSLNFLDMSVFGKYLKEDVVNIMSTYLLHGVRRAEYARRFGNDGEGLAAMMDNALHIESSLVKDDIGSKDDKAVATEMSKRYARYTKAIMAMEGTLGYDISPTLRRVNSGMMVYQNLRILPLAIFSSLIDPLGIVVRSGSLKDGFDAFTLGLKNLTKSLQKNGQGPDPRAKMAELLGIVDNKEMLDTLGQTYQSIYLYGWAKKLNDKLFQWNGMESWNRSMRTAATQTAINFIGDHAQNKSEHSERWLAELGLEAKDVKFNSDGSVKVLREEGLSDGDANKMRVAVSRFVDSAVLRPSSAQRPAWASDPHYALFFHLKQFTYSFHQVILKRAYHEFQHGNLTPAMILLSYIPLMMAADIAKGFIQGGGQEPDWKKGWTVGDYAANAVQRAGLLGVGQFALDAKHAGLATLGGPTVDQISRAVTDPASSTLVNALPANPLYRDMFHSHGHNNAKTGNSSAQFFAADD